MDRKIIVTLIVGLIPATLFAQGASRSQERALNPICPPGVYIADPEVRQMPDGRIYLYGSRDEPGNPWCSYSYDILSTSDLVHWSIDQRSFATRGNGKQADYTNKLLYAPDCIERNGHYYLFYCLEGGNRDPDEGVACATSPYGPFLQGRPVSGALGIDPSVFIDDDGQAYLFWGQAYAKGAKLSKDMMSLDGPIHDSLLTYERDAFNEASSVRKRNGIYYYVYAGHQRHGASNCATLNYATAKSPLGPYTYRGVIIDNFGSQDKLVNNHGCITEINGKWYVFYHRPTHGGTMMRKACVEPIEFNADGTIKEVEMTTQGPGGPIDPRLRMEAARACLLSGHVNITDSRPPYDLPVEYLAGARDGDKACWRYFDFTKRSIKSFTCKTTGNNLPATIDIHLDSAEGGIVGTCNLASGQGETAYSIHSTSVRSITGKHAIWLVFKACRPEDKGRDLLNLDWFIFDSAHSKND